MTNKKCTSVTITTHNIISKKFIKLLCDCFIAISKKSLDVHLKWLLISISKDCLGNSRLIFVNNLLGFLKLWWWCPSKNFGIKISKL